MNICIYMWHCYSKKASAFGMPDPLFVQVLAATTQEYRERMLSLQTARQMASKNIHSTLMEKQDNRLRLRIKRANPHTDGSVVNAVHSLVNRGWVIEALDLTSVRLSADELRNLLPILMHCRCMTHLNMAGNLPTLQMATAFAAPLRTVLCQSLRSLDLSGNNLNAVSARVMAQGLARCTALTSLELENNKLDTEGATIVLSALHRGPASVLRELNLGENEMTEDIAPELARVLGQCSALTRLCLDNNHLRARGAFEIIAALQRGPAPVLRDLSLLNILMNESGAECLADAMKAWPALESLDITANLINDRAATGIAAALPQLPSLTRLDLRDNFIDSAGARELADAMPNCAKLKELDLERNWIKDSGFRALLNRAGSCQSLQRLLLNYNFISDRAVRNAQFPDNVRVYAESQADTFEDSSDDDD